MELLKTLLEAGYYRKVDTNITNIDLITAVLGDVEAKFISKYFELNPHMINDVDEPPYWDDLDENRPMSGAYWDLWVKPEYTITKTSDYLGSPVTDYYIENIDLRIRPNAKHQGRRVDITYVGTPSTDGELGGNHDLGLPSQSQVTQKNRGT